MGRFVWCVESKPMDHLGLPRWHRPLGYVEVASRDKLRELWGLSWAEWEGKVELRWSSWWN